MALAKTYNQQYFSPLEQQLADKLNNAVRIKSYHTAREIISQVNRLDSISKRRDFYECLSQEARMIICHQASTGHFYLS
jgi:hypothetical protein